MLKRNNDFFVIAAAQYQKKWKSLRDSYMREKKTQKAIKSGSAAKTHKVYVFYEQLKFLEAGCTRKKTTDSFTNDQENGSGEEEDVDGDLEEVTVETSSQQERRQIRKRSSKENTNKQEEDLIEILKAKYLREDSNTVEPDADKLFLLSLYDDLKAVPPHLKVRVKSQMLEILSSAQQSSYSPQFPPNHQFTGVYSKSHHGRHSSSTYHSFPSRSFSAPHSPDMMSSVSSVYQFEGPTSTHSYQPSPLPFHSPTTSESVQLSDNNTPDNANYNDFQSMN